MGGPEGQRSRVPANPAAALVKGRGRPAGNSADWLANDGFWGERALAKRNRAVGVAAFADETGNRSKIGVIFITPPDLKGVPRGSKGSIWTDHFHGFDSLIFSATCFSR